MYPHVVCAARRSVALASLVTLTALAACARAPRAPTGITTGDGVLQAMRERYGGTWYRSLTFAQRVQAPAAGGAPARQAVRYGAMAIPGRLRIENDSTGRSGQLFARDSQFVIVNNQLRRGVPGHNVVLVLGNDVYAQPPARTAEILRGLGFPAGPVREDAWEGRPAYVVGGRGPNDLHSHQLWVDKERLVLVRLLQPAPGDTARTFEVRLGDHRPLSGGWYAAQVDEYINGARTLRQEYLDVRANVALGAAVFDPRQWKEGTIRRP